MLGQEFIVTQHPWVLGGTLLETLLGTDGPPSGLALSVRLVLKTRQGGTL